MIGIPCLKRADHHWRLVLALASPARPLARWANMAFPQLAGDPTQVARAILLLSLPQLGLRMLGGESGRNH